jgi:phosphoenolpyruvate carboxykinase (GTP)
LNVSGLSLDASQLEELFRVEPKVWADELKRYQEFLATFGDRLPAGIKAQQAVLEKRVAEALLK